MFKQLQKHENSYRTRKKPQEILILLEYLIATFVSSEPEVTKPFKMCISLGVPNITNPHPLIVAG